MTLIFQALVHTQEPDQSHHVQTDQKDRCVIESQRDICARDMIPGVQDHQQIIRII